ncbi:MAG: hypothetical protein WDM89_14625 [Rhizomicrobium sp.]
MGFNDMPGTTLPFGRSKWGEHDHARALFGKLADRRRLTVDAQRVGDNTVGHGDVQIRANQHALSFNVHVIERPECRHELSFPRVEIGAEIYGQTPPWTSRGLAGFCRVCAPAERGNSVEDSSCSDGAPGSM